MLSELHEDEKALTLSMRAVHTLCDDEGDVATASLLENWIDQSQAPQLVLIRDDTRLGIRTGDRPPVRYHSAGVCSAFIIYGLARSANRGCSKTWAVAFRIASAPAAEHA